MLPVLRASAKGEVRLGQLVKELADELALTEEERMQRLPSGGTTVLASRIAWAKTYLLEAGLLRSTRWGHFTISKNGTSLLATKLTRIDNKILSQYPEFLLFLKRSSKTSEGVAVPASPVVQEQNQTPDEAMRLAYQQVDTALARNLLDRVRQAPPEFFERLIVKLLLSMGYGGSTDDAGRTLGRSGDDGVDGVIDQDALGLDRVYIQAKRYAESNNIGPGAIRDFFGSLDRHKAAKGLFVTTSSFSTSAIDTAEGLSKRLVLIDGTQLAKLMIRHNVGCRVEDTLYIKKVDEEFFD